jgi:hypothetical protein
MGGVAKHLKHRGAWLAATAVLLLIGVPWYWPSPTGSAWLIPDWAWLSLGAAAAWSGLIVWATLFAWPDEDSKPHE